MDQPRIARLEEYAEAMAFTDMVFRPGQKGRLILQRQYPHAYRRTARHTRRLHLVRDEGAIVGCLAIHPMTIRIGDARLKSGGIGIVGTHPQRRGEGIMSTMLRHAIRLMERGGYALSVLGGDRQRYGWFGWENAGTRNSFQLTRRSLGEPTAAEGALVMRRFEASRALCRRLQRLGARRHSWIQRPLDDMAPLLMRNGRHTWVCEDGNRLAYVVLGGADRKERPYERVDEAGGDADLVRGMLRILMKRHRLEALSATCGPNADEVALFLPVSQSWQRSCDCMIRIIDLAVLVEQLQPLLYRRAHEVGIAGRFRLIMTDSDQCVDLELGKGPRRGRLELPDRTFVQLLFGILPVSESLSAVGGGSAVRTLRDLSAILPLPFYIPPINHI